MSENETSDLIFYDGPDDTAESVATPWQILIVDDSEEVHTATRMVLSKVVFEERKLQFLSAFSAAEGAALMRSHPDIALVFLDVVMEHDHAGLDLVRIIRDDIGNPHVRIILRTGQPGQAPERQVVLQYDINDYKHKAELSAEGLFTATIASLRAYRDLVALDAQRSNLRGLLRLMPQFYEHSQEAVFFALLTTAVVEQLDTEAALVGLFNVGLFDAGVFGGHGQVFASAGAWADRQGQPLEQVAQAEFAEAWQALCDGATAVDGPIFAVLMPSRSGPSSLLVARRHAEGPRDDTLALLAGLTPLALDNRRLVSNLEAEVQARTASLAAANQHLQRLNDEKTAFLGIAAHDLRSPLSGVLLAVDDMLEDPDERHGAAGDANLAKIRDTVRHASEILHRLLDVSAIESGKFRFHLQSLDLVPSLLETCTTYRERALGKRIRLDWQMPPRLTARADQTAFRQIADNLISNAVKYSPADRQIEIHLQTIGQRARLTVSDQGPGLTAEDRSRLFEKFAKLSARPTAGEPSSGLGLAIVKLLVDGMGGSIECHSEPGQGTRFVVELPLLGS